MSFRFLFCFSMIFAFTINVLADDDVVFATSEDIDSFDKIIQRQERDSAKDSSEKKTLKERDSDRKARRESKEKNSQRERREERVERRERRGEGNREEKRDFIDQRRRTRPGSEEQKSRNVQRQDNKPERRRR